MPRQRFYSRRVAEGKSLAAPAAAAARDGLAEAGILR